MDLFDFYLLDCSRRKNKTLRRMESGRKIIDSFATEKLFIKNKEELS